MNMIQFEQASVAVSSAVASGSLPALIDSARKALDSARNSGEVLEALAMTRVAYDAAKSAGRLAKAKEAHDSLLSEIYRAQADILMTEARGKMRLAEEYDAAQDRGEVAGPTGNNLRSEAERKPTAADVGLSRKDIHEARQIRDAERADPGITERTLNDIVGRGEEPTKAKLNREVFKPKAEPQKVMDPKALWLWGRLKDFERDGIIRSNAKNLLSEMTEPMRADVRRLAPLVREFIEELEMIV